MKKVILVSSHKIDEEAVFSAFDEVGMRISLMFLQGVSTGVENIQLLEEEVFIAVKNKIHSALIHLENARTDWDYIIAVEDGIFYSHMNSQWFGKVVVGFYEGCEQREPIYISASEKSALFPNKFIKETRDVGFNRTTVARVMFDEGYIDNPEDPYKSLIGESRTDLVADEIHKILRLEVDHA